MFLFSPKIQNTIHSQKHAYHAQLEALSFFTKDNENVRHYALKVEALVEKSWYNEYPSTINPKFDEDFTRGLQKKRETFCQQTSCQTYFKLT